MRTKSQKIEDQMYRLYQERGAMTDKDLALAGFTPDEIVLFSPRIAVRVLRETPIAA